MAKTNEEKLLGSIDNTLKDILKELKRQGRNENRDVLHIKSPQNLKNPPQDSELRTGIMDSK